MELGTVPESIHAGEDKEDEQYVTFTGKLKTKPKEGRRTTKDKPTAWSIFAAHDEEQEEVKIYITNFTDSASSIEQNLT